MILPKNWAVTSFEEILDYEQPTAYIVKSTNYDDAYETAVLTAGKSFIIGYTNEKTGIYSKNLPVIIFDDFTSATQYVTFPFKVKSSAMKILQPVNDKLNKKYIYYFMQTIKHNVTTHKRYWISDYSKRTIPFPPITEQHRIVAKIDALFSKLDKGVETLKTIRQQLRIYRQAVLEWALEKKEWEMKPLRSIVETIFDGPFGSNLKTDDYTDNGVRVVRLENLKPMRFFDGKKSYISFEKYQILSRNTVKYPDLIMGTFISGEIKVCLIPEGIEKAINKADCVCIRTSNPTLSRFVMYYLSSKRVYDRFFSQIHGATRPRVNTTQIKEIFVPVATANEQAAIVTEIESRLSVCDKLEAIVDESLAKAEALRQSILKKAFAGQLVPQDPNDEPAEKLLERIRKEKYRRMERMKTNELIRDNSRDSMTLKRSSQVVKSKSSRKSKRG